jgi:hypothetical protein
MNVLPHVLNRCILRFRSLVLPHLQEARGKVNLRELTDQQAIFRCVPGHSEFLDQKFTQVETPIEVGGLWVRGPETLQEGVSCPLISPELGANEVSWRVLKLGLDDLHRLDSLERRLELDGRVLINAGISYDLIDSHCAQLGRERHALEAHVGTRMRASLGTLCNFLSSLLLESLL